MYLLIASASSPKVRPSTPEGVNELLRMQFGGCHPVDGCQDGDGFAGADFDYLAANVTDDDTGRTLFRPYEIRRVGGVKVGFIGVVLKDTPTIVTPSGVEGLTFGDEADAINKYTAVLKKKGGPSGSKGLKERMFAMMTPSGSESLGTSKLNFFGAGSVMLRQMMKDKGIASLEELAALARELGVRMTACTMSMDAMGVAKEELTDGLEYGGVATFMADATRARVSLFV